MHHLNIIARFLMVCIVPLALGFSACYAMGFGPSKLHSYLNEPLNLDIELVDAESVSIDNLTASLASVDDFKRAEMQRPYFLSRLRFEVKRIGRRSFIRVTSPDAIKQPFLDFLVDLSWPGGHSVKGYTILLDPAPANSASGNAIPKAAQDNKNQNKYEGKIGDKQNMESLFGPEDKTQIPVSPKIETIAKDPQLGQSELKPQESQSSADAMSLFIGPKTEATSLGGKLINSFSNELQNQQNINPTTPNNISHNNDSNVNASPPSIKSVSSKKLLPANLQAGEKGLPVWLFWTSILGMLCIVSLTIWALNKYRLAKPKPKSDSEYFEAIGNEKDHANTLNRRRKKIKSSEKSTTEPDPSLKEALSLKLLLAEQYIEVNDQEAAKKLLEEILAKGNDQQKAEAQNLSMKMNIND